MDDEDENSEIKNKIFSPIDGNWINILTTFIYLTILISFTYFLLVLTFNPVNNFNTLLLSFISGLLKGSILAIILLSLVLSILIHKTFLKGLLVIAVIVGLYSIVGFAISTNEERGYLILSLFYIIPFALVVLALGIVARSFFRISSKALKGIILVIPFIIIIIIGSFYVGGSQQPDEEFCLSLSTSGQIDCFYKMAIQEKSYHYCTKIQGDSLAVSKCRNEVASMLKAEGRLDQTMCAQEIDRNDVIIYSGKSICYWFLAEKLSDESICDQAPDVQININCHNAFSEQRKVFE